MNFSYIQQHNLWLFQYGSRNGNSLQLATRQLHAALADPCLVPIAKCKYLVVYGSSLACVINFFVSRIKPRVPNVVDDRIVEKNGILWHDANVRTQTVQVHIPDILAVNSDAAVRHVVEPVEQFQYGTLAGARLTNEAGITVSIDTPYK